MSKKIINVVAAAIEQDGKIFCAQDPKVKVWVVSGNFQVEN